MNYVILGSSAAGVNAVREIRKQDPQGRIVLISKDSRIYSRCILHHYLGNIRTPEQLSFVEPDFETRYGVEWMRGCQVGGLDVKKQEVLLEDGGKVSYDKLLIATGSHTFFPPVPGMKEAKNVIGFRNLEDIDAIKTAVKTKRHVIIMGAGLVGLDAASGLLDLGIVPVIVDMADHLLCKQLDKKAAGLYEEAFSKEGVKQYYSAEIRELLSDDRQCITEMVLNDGRRLPCDYLIVTAGVRSNTDFLKGSGVEADRFGLVFNARGETNAPHVYGAGDVSGRAPIWPAAVKEGIIAGSNMAGGNREMTDFFASKATMNFLEIPTMSLGEVEPSDSTVTVEAEENGGGYKKIIHKDGRITGAIIQGDLSYSGILQQLISHRIDVSRVKKPLFEIDYSDFFHEKTNFEYYYEEETNE